MTLPLIYYTITAQLLQNITITPAQQVKQVVNRGYIVMTVKEEGSIYLDIPSCGEMGGEMGGELVYQIPITSLLTDLNHI